MPVDITYLLFQKAFDKDGHVVNYTCIYKAYIENGLLLVPCCSSSFKLIKIFTLYKNIYMYIHNCLKWQTGNC